VKCERDASATQPETNAMYKPLRVEIDRIPSRSVRGRYASGLPREVVGGLVRASVHGMNHSDFGKEARHPNPSRVAGVCVPLSLVPRGKHA
jgi:hypothetical protein